jgi:MFS family permease
MSPFTRLAVTHALMMAGDAAMVVALADSFFFSVDLDAARTQVLLFLAISFAPFLFVAPLIGPMIDRIAGGRRLVIQTVAIARLGLLILMAQYIDGLALFPLVFASLVLQKTYIVSKSALVPSTVRSATELVEANSKLGLLAGITGAVAVIPAGLLLKLIGPGGALMYGAILFGLSFASATKLPKEVVADHAAGEVESAQLHSARLQVAALAMTVLRANVGFTFFHLAFWLRSQDKGTLLFGVAVGASALATMCGNAIAPRLRERMQEETMLSVALVVSAAGGIGLAVLGGPVGGVILAGVVNFVASVGRLSFESIVQRDAPGANQGRAFATFETRFQFAWAAAAFIAVAIRAPGAIGFLIVGVVAAATLVHLRIGTSRNPSAVAVRRRRKPRGASSRRRRRPPPPPGRRRPTTEPRR